MCTLGRERSKLTSIAVALIPLAVGTPDAKTCILIAYRLLELGELTKLPLKSSDPAGTQCGNVRPMHGMKANVCPGSRLINRIFTERIQA